MKTFLIALALLAGASAAAVRAQEQAATDENIQPSAQAAASKAQAERKAGAPIDISILVPKDSAQEPAGDQRPGRGDRVDQRGVHCEHYPARCRAGNP